MTTIDSIKTEKELLNGKTLLWVIRPTLVYAIVDHVVYQAVPQADRVGWRIQRGDVGAPATEWETLGDLVFRCIEDAQDAIRGIIRHGRVLNSTEIDIEVRSATKGKYRWFSDLLSALMGGTRVTLRNDSSSSHAVVKALYGQFESLIKIEE